MISSHRLYSFLTKRIFIPIFVEKNDTFLKINKVEEFKLAKIQNKTFRRQNENIARLVKYSLDVQEKKNQTEYLNS